MQKIQTVRNRLRQETGENPSAEAIAALTGIAPEAVEELILLDPEICSLDIPVGSDEGGTLGTLIEDDRTVPPQEEMKPWQYLVTIFSSLIFLYSFVILVLMPEFVLEALQDLFGDYLLALIFGSMIVIGMWLYVIVTRDES
jgi:hypothetical protein